MERFEIVRDDEGVDVLYVRDPDGSSTSVRGSAAIQELARLIHNYYAEGTDGEGAEEGRS